MRGFVLLLSLLVLPSTASAQSAGAQAEVLFRDGRELMAAGKYAEACSALEQSHKLEPAVTTLINLAGCREKLGQFATAWGLFLDAERQTRSATDASSRKLHDLARARASKLEPRVSKLAINVPDHSRIDGLAVTRDNEPVDAVMWNRALPVDGGTHTITARAPGANEWTTKVVVADESDTKTVEIPDLRNLPRDLPTTGPTPPLKSPEHDQQTREAASNESEESDETEPRPTSRRRLVPIVASAGAVLLLGGCAGTWVWGDSNYDKARSEQTDQMRRDDLYDSANMKRRVALGLGVAGLATGGLAVWLFVRHDDDAARLSAQHRQVVVSPTGIAVVGTF
jgi:serine/threonine-protein kinase